MASANFFELNHNAVGYMGFSLINSLGVEVEAPTTEHSVSVGIMDDNVTNVSRTFLVILPQTGTYTFAAKFSAEDPEGDDGEVFFFEPTISVQPVKEPEGLARSVRAGSSGRAGAATSSSGVEVLRQLLAKHPETAPAKPIGKLLHGIVARHDADAAAAEAAAAAAAAEEAAAAEAAAEAAKAPKQPVRAAFKAAVYGPK
jgi:hypothetical protein